MAIEVNINKGAGRKAAQPCVEESVEPCVEQYLEQVNALAHELDFAMRAIAADSLEALEASVRRQQEGGVKLQIADAALTQRLAALPARGLRAGSISRLRAAIHRLAVATEQYAALLTHASRSNRMLQALYRQLPVVSEAMQGSGMWSWSWEG